MLNGYAHIWLLYLFAAFCLDFSVLANTITTGGLQLEPGFDNPLLQSRSLTQAWGTRWNKPVQLLLQRSAYTPLRRQALSSSWSRPAAVLATFAASGLLHEYNFYVHNGGQHYQAGRATLFFLLMGMLMLGQEAIVQRLLPPNSILQQRVVSNIPTAVISIALTLLAAWPFEKYFIQSWKDAGLVQVIAQLLPTITCHERNDFAS